MDFEELTAEEHDRIVGAGLDLMSSITDSFGPEEGQKIWNDLSTQFGDGIKHAIFIAMLSGRASGSLTVHGQKGVRQQVNYIEFIKIVRNYTGYGLREAKDFCDAVDGGMSKTLKVDYKQRAYFVRSLRELGVIAT